MLASFSWECTLKITIFKVELLTNVDMILHYENAIKGRITRAICQFLIAKLILLKLFQCLHIILL